MARWSRKAAWFERAAERREIQVALDRTVASELCQALSPWEAAQACGVSDSFLAELRRRDEGPAFWWMGPSIYYMPEDLRLWIASCRVVPYRNAVDAHVGR